MARTRWDFARESLAGRNVLEDQESWPLTVSIVTVRLKGDVAASFVHILKTTFPPRFSITGPFVGSAFPTLHVAPVGDLGYNADVYLAADYTPEFDSFKERLLELAQIRSVAELLRRVVTRLAELPYVALVRIWLVDRGDLCSSCCMRPECPDQTSCLHLAASAGRPQADPKADWSRLDDEFQRIPLGVGKIGRVAATGQALVVKDVAREPSMVTQRKWHTE